ncbi:hypothetical protein [Streptomyces sp. NPDC091278]|uniref:hypothetical protein n=1 Tax=Streptomyces sp. NPDC091278 TaxID=3155301 RepID=UPI00344DF3CB
MHPTASAARRAAEAALVLQLGTTRRDDLDAAASELTVHLEALLSSFPPGAGDLGRLREEGAHLLAERPGRDALPYSVWAHMRALARVVRRLDSLGGGE